MTRLIVSSLVLAVAVVGFAGARSVAQRHRTTPSSAAAAIAQRWQQQHPHRSGDSVPRARLRQVAGVLMCCGIDPDTVKFVSAGSRAFEATASAGELDYLALLSRLRSWDVDALIQVDAVIDGARSRAVTVALGKRQGFAAWVDPALLAAS